LGWDENEKSVQLKEMIMKYFLLTASIACLSLLAGCSEPSAFEPAPVAKTIDAPQVASTPEPEPAPIPEPANVEPPKPVITKMEKAPNGRSWPRGSGYVRGYAIRNEGGMSSLTIDNTGSDNSYFVKLVDISSGEPRGVRYIKVTGGSSFTIEDLAPSVYEIRYMDIVTRSAAKSESINVTETVTETYEGRTTNYSTIRITLYTLAGGNTQMTPIREEDF
jgi:hypothetical protein